MENTVYIEIFLLVFMLLVSLIALGNAPLAFLVEAVAVSFFSLIQSESPED